MNSSPFLVRPVVCVTMASAASDDFVLADGDGYPSVAALSVNTFAFADFQHVFTIDTTVPAIVTKQLFDGYFVDGNFFFLPPQ